MILGLLTFLSSSIRRLFYIFDFLFIFLLVSLFYIFCFYCLTCFKSNINYYFCQYCLCFNRGNFIKKLRIFPTELPAESLIVEPYIYIFPCRTDPSLRSFLKKSLHSRPGLWRFHHKRSFLHSLILLPGLHSSASRGKPLALPSKPST